VPSLQTALYVAVDELSGPQKQLRGYAAAALVQMAQSTLTVKRLVGHSVMEALEELKTSDQESPNVTGTGTVGRDARGALFAVQAAKDRAAGLSSTRAQGQKSVEDGHVMLSYQVSGSARIPLECMCVRAVGPLPSLSQQTLL
jgi:hypothetical protein